MSHGHLAGTIGQAVVMAKHVLNISSATQHLTHCLAATLLGPVILTAGYDLDVWVAVHRLGKATMQLQTQVSS